MGLPCNGALFGKFSLDWFPKFAPPNELELFPWEVEEEKLGVQFFPVSSFPRPCCNVDCVDTNPGALCLGAEPNNPGVRGDTFGICCCCCFKLKPPISCDDDAGPGKVYNMKMT